ncbi:hypothetical protein SDC9_123108 [bioreactor metagenome]|uniref:Uncharacterized protein n=1 Tax=bioreactor metagenome TaxID=1076179 RepID=A0A645CGS9_9ZZZZ
MLATQVGILDLDLDQGREIHRSVAYEIGWRRRRHLQRVGCYRHALTQHFQIAETQVGHQHRQTERDEDQQADQRCRSAPKDGGRLMAD